MYYVCDLKGEEMSNETELTDAQKAQRTIDAEFAQMHVIPAGESRAIPIDELVARRAAEEASYKRHAQDVRDSIAEQKTGHILKPVDADSIIAFAKTLEGQVMETRKRNRQFTVFVTKKGIELTPLSTGKTRMEPYKSLRRVCDQFSSTNSFNTAEYRYTNNISYVLALIGKHTNQ
jgi:hypothetical protein